MAPELALVSWRLAAAQLVPRLALRLAQPQHRLTKESLLQAPPPPPHFARAQAQTPPEGQAPPQLARLERVPPPLLPPPPRRHGLPDLVHPLVQVVARAARQRKLQI